MPSLRVNLPAGRSFRYELGEALVRIGRSRRNDVVVDDATVSRQHAEIVREGEIYHLRDAGGRHGTFLNDRPVAGPTPLHSGDQIRCGGVILDFDPPPPSEVTLVQAPVPTGGGATFLSAEEAGLGVTAPAGTGAAARRGPGRPSPLSVVSEADRRLAFHRPIGEILETIMDLAQQAVGFERGVLMLREGNGLASRVVRVPREEEGKPLRISAGIVGHVLDERQALLTSDAQSDPMLRERDSIHDLGLRSVLCVPLWSDGAVVGLIYLDSRFESGLFDQDDLRVLSHLAQVAAGKIENARLFEQVVRAAATERELEQARQIQDQLLPAGVPRIEGYQVHASSVPCLAVGGDCYDFIPLAGGKQVVAIGDVAGKGLPAALLMGFTLASLRAVFARDRDPGDAVPALNRLLCPWFPANRYVTFFCGVLDPSAHRLTYVNAGHNPPRLVRAGGPGESLSLGGPPLGLLPDAPYRSDAIDFGPGDLLLCFSDGAFEGRNPAGEMFGEERLAAIAGEASGRSPDRIVQAINEEIDRHLAGAPHEDDITFLVLRRER